MDIEQRTAQAIADLEKHKPRLLRLWGKRYKTHPEYHEVVSEIATKARAPIYALLDREGL